MPLKLGDGITISQQVYDNSSGSAISGSNWGAWNTQYSTSSSITTSYNVAGNNWFVWNQVHVEQTERQAQLDAMADAQRAATKALAQKQKAATERAEVLLLENLTEDQRKEYKQHRRFTVHTGNGERTYRVEYGIAGNIKRLNKDGRPITKFCIHPDAECPTPDVMLAQKLMIETDEQTFLRVANHTELAA